MRVLVTGAGGFIGSRLTAALVERGDTVRALFLPGEDATKAAGLGVEVRRGDVTRPETLRGMADGIDTVFHLAARVSDWGPESAFRSVTVDGTQNLLDVCGQAERRFVYVSSFTALGLTRPLVGLDEEAPVEKTGIPYSDAKADAEKLVLDRCGGGGGPVTATIVRPANVIGPGGVWVADLLEALSRGPVPLIERGQAPCSFVHVDNLVDGVLAAADAEVAEGRVYHFRDDFDITWAEYITTLGGWVGRAPRGSLPFRVAWTMATALEKMATPIRRRPPLTRLVVGLTGQDNDVSSHRARDELDWRSRVSLDEAMAGIEAWVRAER